MKKYISIFELFTRSTIYKILLVFAAMGAAQVFMFHRAMPEWFPADSYHLNFQAIEYYTLEYMVDRSKSAIFLGIAFVVITAILCWNGCDIGSKSSYTIQRLQVTEKKIFIMQSIYNSLCYLLLLGTQIGVFFIQSSLYAQRAGHLTNQTIFLAFYRNDFMHSVLPLEGTVRWGINILIVLGCGISAAMFTYRQRRGKTAGALLVAVACVLFGFVQELGEVLGFMIVVIIWLIVGFQVYWNLIQKKEGE